MEENIKAPESTAQTPVSAASEEEVKAPESDALNQENKNGQSRGGRQGGRQSRDGQRRSMNKREMDPYKDHVVSINKITKVVKGGKHMRFAALVVIGDEKGKVGFGQGKSVEVPVAIKKANEYAHSNLSTVAVTKDKTIPHEVRGKCGVCEVYLKPAPLGTGIIAGGAVRSIIQLAGIKNIYSKVYGRRTPINVVRATFDAISKLKSREYVERSRFGNSGEVAVSESKEAK